MNQKVVEDFSLLIKNEENLSELKRKKSFNEYVEFFSQSFNWKPGAYSADVEVNLKNTKKVYKANFSFKLSQSNISRLEENKELCKLNLENIILPQEDQKNIVWNWVNPEIIAK